ncbi:hypothetical protein FM107_17520 [Sphingobacterium sp. JB170]|nr:hypothetical protein FM107_17520 [Sphingobacterium sp. JB170]
MTNSSAKLTRYFQEPKTADRRHAYEAFMLWPIGTEEFTYSPAFQKKNL